MKQHAHDRIRAHLPLLEVAGSELERRASAASVGSK